MSVRPPTTPKKEVHLPEGYRDDMAKAALQGLLARAIANPSALSHDWVAAEAYLFADAMEVARDAT